MKLVILLRLILPLVAILTTACAPTTQVHFSDHAAYPSSSRHDSSLAIVVPDDLAEGEKRIDLGTKISPMPFNVHYGEGFEIELGARFAKMFNSVVFIKQSEYNEAMGFEQIVPLVVLGEEAAEVEAAERSILEDEELPEFVKNQRGYLLKLSNIDWALEQDRAVVAFNVQYIDMYIGETLFEGRMGARGTEVTRGPSPSFIGRRMRDSTVAALTAAAGKLADRMRAAME